MNIIYVLIPLGLVLLGVAVWAFFWAVDNGQFDDLESPPLRILDENGDNATHTPPVTGPEQVPPS